MWQGDLDAIAEDVFEVGIDRTATRFLNEPNQAADPDPRELEHRKSDVDPPFVARDGFQQHCLPRHRRDGRLAQQCGRDLLHCFPDSLSGQRVTVELRELAAEDQQVEPLRVFIVVPHGRRAR